MTNKLFYIKIGSFSYVTECYEYKNSKIKGMVSTLDKRKALKMLIEEIINDEYTEDNKKEVQIEQLEIIDLE